MYEGGWHDKKEVVVDDVLSLTMAVSFAMMFSTRKRL